jgi:hypothetical protein
MRRPAPTTFGRVFPATTLAPAPVLQHGPIPEAPVARLTRLPDSARSSVAGEQGRRTNLQEATVFSDGPRPVQQSVEPAEAGRAAVQRLEPAVEWTAVPRIRPARPQRVN